MRPSAQSRATLRAGALAAAVLAAACSGGRGCAAAAPAARPAGTFLYVVHDAPGSNVPSIDPHVTAWRVEDATGGLQPIDRGSASTGAVGAFALAVDPSGRFFSLAGSQLALLTASERGGLARPPGQPAAGLASAFDPRGRFYYLVTGGGLAVHPLRRAGVDLATTVHTEPGVVLPELAATPDGTRLYAAGEELRAWQVGDDGRLTAAPGSPYTLSFRVIALYAHPGGRFLVALVEVGDRRRVAVLDAAADGSVAHAPGSPFDVGHDVRAIALTPDGTTLFLTDGDRHSLESFAFDADGGLHRAASAPAAVDEAGALVVDPSGRFLYASSMGTGRVHAWRVSDGALTEVAGSPFEAGPRACEMVALSSAAPLVATALPSPGRFEADATPAPDRASPAGDLAAALQDPSDRRRLEAIMAFANGARDLTPVLPAIVEALDDRHERVRLLARHLLGPYALQHPGAVDIEILGRLVAAPGDRPVGLDNASLTALRALKVHGAAAAPQLARALVNHGQLGEDARDALTDLGPAALPALPDLRRLLQHSQANRHAADAIGAIGPAAVEALPELYELAGHRSRVVAGAARRAIARIRAVG